MEVVREDQYFKLTHNTQLKSIVFFNQKEKRTQKDTAHERIQNKVNS